MTAIYGGFWQVPIIVLLPILVFMLAGCLPKFFRRAFSVGQLILFALVLLARMYVIHISDHTAEKFGILFYNRGEPTAWGVGAEIAIVALSIGTLVFLFLIGAALTRRVSSFKRIPDRSVS